MVRADGQIGGNSGSLDAESKIERYPCIHSGRGIIHARR
jgi:hypothetical protein